MAAVRPHTKDATSTIDFTVEGDDLWLVRGPGPAGAGQDRRRGRCRRTWPPPAPVTLERPLPTADLQARVAKIGLTPWPRRPAAATTRRSGPAGPAAPRGWSPARCSRSRPCWPAPA